MIFLTLFLNTKGQNPQLVAYYPLNGNTNDSLGQHNGIYHGSSEVYVNDTAGNPNSALFFNGSDSWIEVNPFLSLRDSDLFIVSMWVYSLGITISPKSKLITFGYRDSSTLGSSGVQLLNQFNFGFTDYAVVREVLSVENFSSATTIEMNPSCRNDTNYAIPQFQWYHVALVHSSPGYNENSFEFYINSRICSYPNTVTFYGNDNPFPTFGSMSIGIYMKNGIDEKTFFWGYLDDIRIYLGNDISNSRFVDSLYRNPPGQSPHTLVQSINKIIEPIIYPNPSTGEINIKSEYNSIVKIFDLIGNLILEEELSKKNTKILKLVPGIYQFVFNNGITKKIIIL